MHKFFRSTPGEVVVGGDGDVDGQHRSRLFFLHLFLSEIKLATVNITIHLKHGKNMNYMTNDLTHFTMLEKICG